jgi:hypothetical protein
MLSGKRYSSWMQMLGIENVVELILRTETTKCLYCLLSDLCTNTTPDATAYFGRLTPILVAMLGTSVRAVLDES